MAIFCLATSLADLKERLGQASSSATRATRSRSCARDLKAHGAMTALLKDALAPNLVQTLENNPAFIHGGPFANIAHGCNSVIATQHRAQARRLRGDRGRLRRRPRRGEVRRHQVPQGGPAAGGGGDRRHGARAEVPRRRRGGRSASARTSRRSRRASSTSSGTSTTCATATACRAWSRSTTAREDTDAEIQLLIDRVAPHGVQGHPAHATSPRAARGALEVAQGGRAAVRAAQQLPVRLRGRRARCGTR